MCVAAGTNAKISPDVIPYLTCRRIKKPEQAVKTQTRRHRRHQDLRGLHSFSSLRHINMLVILIFVQQFDTLNHAAKYQACAHVHFQNIEHSSNIESTFCFSLCVCNYLYAKYVQQKNSNIHHAKNRQLVKTFP